MLADNYVIEVKTKSKNKMEKENKIFPGRLGKSPNEMTKDELIDCLNKLFVENTILFFLYYLNNKINIHESNLNCIMCDRK